jgi:hypothetical protein
MDQKENHGIEWQEGWMTLQEWKKKGPEAKLDLMERWGARNWPPPVLSNFTDGNFKIKEYEGSDTETVSVASSDDEGLWGLEPSQRDKIKKEAPGAPGKNYDWKYGKTLYRRGPDPVAESSKDDGFSSINCLYIGFDEDGIAQEVKHQVSGPLPLQSLTEIHQSIWWQNVRNGTEQNLENRTEMPSTRAIASTRKICLTDHTYSRCGVW